MRWQLPYTAHTRLRHVLVSSSVGSLAIFLGVQSFSKHDTAQAKQRLRPSLPPWFRCASCPAERRNWSDLLGSVAMRCASRPPVNFLAGPISEGMCRSCRPAAGCRPWNLSTRTAAIGDCSRRKRRACRSKRKPISEPALRLKARRAFGSSASRSRRGSDCASRAPESVTPCAGTVRAGPRVAGSSQQTRPISLGRDWARS